MCKDKKEQDKEEAKAFVSTINGGVDWCRVLQQNLTSLHPGSWLLLVNLCVVVAHAYSLQLHLGEVIQIPWPKPKLGDEMTCSMWKPEEEVQKREDGFRMSDLLSSDPMTMLYDAAVLLSQDRKPVSVIPPTPPPIVESMPHKLVDGGTKSTLAVHATSFGCISGTMLLLVLCSFLVSQHQACTELLGYNVLRRKLALPLTSLCGTCLLGSWVFCDVFLGMFMKDYSLATCCAMHSSAAVLGAALVTACECPWADVFIPKMLCNSLAAGMAFLLFAIAHMQAWHVSTEEFYMHHMWATLVVCPFVARMMVGRALLFLHDLA